MGSVRDSEFFKNIEMLGGIVQGEFTTSNGEQGNVKVELDVLRGELPHVQHIRGLMVGELATRLAVHEPDLLVPVPTGGDYFAEELQPRLGYLPIAYLAWEEKTTKVKRLRPKTTHDKELIQQASKVALIDDVYRTGSNVRAAIEMAEMAGRDVVVGAIFDRSAEAASSAMYPLESAVRKYIPLHD